MYAEKSHRLDSGWLLFGFRVFFAKVNQNLLLGHVYFHLLTAVPTNFRNSWTGRRSANEENGHFEPLKSTLRMYSETSQLPHEQTVQRKYDRICKYYKGQMKKYLFAPLCFGKQSWTPDVFWGLRFLGLFTASQLQMFLECVVCCPFFRDRILIRFCVESVFCLHLFRQQDGLRKGFWGSLFVFCQKCVMLVFCFWPAAKFHLVARLWFLFWVYELQTVVLGFAFFSRKMNALFLACFVFGYVRMVSFFCGFGTFT